MGEGVRSNPSPFYFKAPVRGAFQGKPLLPRLSVERFLLAGVSQNK